MIVMMIPFVMVLMCVMVLMIMQIPMVMVQPMAVKFLVVVVVIVLHLIHKGPVIIMHLLPKMMVHVQFHPHVIHVMVLQLMLMVL